MAFFRLSISLTFRVMLTLSEAVALDCVAFTEYMQQRGSASINIGITNPLLSWQCPSGTATIISYDLVWQTLAQG
jgi:hypothetical protein